MRKTKWVFDQAALREIRVRKEQQRLARNEPPPSPDARCEEFLQQLLKAAIDNALKKLSPEDRAIAAAFYKRPDRAGDTTSAASRSRDDSKLAVILLKLREICRECS